MTCLYCYADGPYSTVQHIVPESLGNVHSVLVEQVCDKCQNYLGKEVEQYALSRSPFAFWKVMHNVPNKKGRAPYFSLKQPPKTSGVLPDRHPANDDSFTVYPGPRGTVEVEVSDDEVRSAVEAGRKNDMRLVLTPKMLHMSSRFLGKIGIEYLAKADAQVARLPRFNLLRRYVRFGEPFRFAWPVLHATSGDTAMETTVFDTDGLIKGRDRHTLCYFRIGTEHWVICLDTPYPHPIILNSFPGLNLKMISYSEYS